MNTVTIFIKIFNPLQVEMEKAKIISEVIGDFFKIALLTVIIVRKRLFHGVINIIMIFTAILIILISNDHVLSFIIIAILTLLENKNYSRSFNKENEKCKS